MLKAKIIIKNILYEVFTTFLQYCLLFFFFYKVFTTLSWLEVDIDFHINSPLIPLYYLQFIVYHLKKCCESIVTLALLLF
jgi:hypothetical protein